MPSIEPCSKPSQQPSYEPSSPTKVLKKAEKMVSNRYHLLGVLQNLLRSRSLLWNLLQCPLTLRYHRPPNPLLLPYSHALAQRNLPMSWKSWRRSWSRLRMVTILSDPVWPTDGCGMAIPCRLILEPKPLSSSDTPWPLGNSILFDCWGQLDQQ
jgi:hypothetical protein